MNHDQQELQRKLNEINEKYFAEMKALFTQQIDELILNVLRKADKENLIFIPVPLNAALMMSPDMSCCIYPVMIERLVNLLSENN